VTDLSLDEFFAQLDDPDDVLRSDVFALDALAMRLQESARAVLKPRSRRTVTEFAEDPKDGIVLTARNGEPIPGKYDQSNNPVARVPQDACADPEVREVVLAACAQGGKSRTLGNVVAHKIVEDPANMILAYPAESTGLEKARTDYFPMFRTVPSVRERVMEQALDKWDKTTLLSIRYPGGTLKIATTGSPTQTASTPSGWAAIDEYSRVENTKEGDPRAALRARMLRFPFYKLIVASTLIGKGCRTAVAYAESDRSIPLVTCPSCGHLHQMKFENIDIPHQEITVVDNETQEVTIERGEMIPSAATYRCPNCSYGMSDGVRYRMIDGVVWRQTAPFHCCGERHAPVVDGRLVGKWDDEGISLCPTCGKRPSGAKDMRGFRWSVLYTKTPLRPTIDQWKAAQGNPVLLRQFWNDKMNEEWEIQERVAKTGSDLAARCEDYEHLYGPGVEVPEPVTVLFASIDVNPSYGLDMNIRGFGNGEESWGIRYLKALGDVGDFSKGGPWFQCDELRRRIWRGVDGRLYRVALTLVDINDPASSEHAKRYVMPRIGSGVMPIKGRYDGPLWNPTASLVGRHVDPHYPVGTIAGKTLVSGRLRILDNGPGKYHWPAEIATPDGEIVQATGYGERYFEELANLKHKPSTSQRGGAKESFKPENSSVRQEAWDTEVYLLAACHAYVMSRGFRSINDLPPTWRTRDQLDEADEGDQKRIVAANAAREHRQAVVKPKPQRSGYPSPARTATNARDPRARGDRI
jgi:phage terminase large subunit GpA-like protein